MKKTNLFVCICVIFCMIFSMTAFADTTATEEVTAIEETEAQTPATEAADEAEATEEAKEETAEGAKEEATEGATEEKAAKEEAADETVQPKDYNDVTAFFRLIGYEIMQGDENGNLNLEDDVTRAEMAQFIINANHMKGIEYAVSADEELFTDVSKDHWAYNTIYLAKSLKVINGHGDGTFEPEGKVTYEQAIKMIVSLLGYAPKADTMGGYPQGYIAVATQIGLTQHIEFEQTANAIRKDIAIMLDTALDIPVMEQIGYGSEPEYKIMDGKDGADLITLEKEFIIEEEVTEEATEEVKEETTEEAKEETAEDVIGEDAEKAEEVTEKATEETVEEAAEEKAEEKTEEKTEE